MQNLYEILNIPTSATDVEIKKSYFKLIKKYSPEKDPIRFKEIRSAYETLNDADLRKEYDTTLELPSEYSTEIHSALQHLKLFDYKTAISTLKELDAKHPNQYHIRKNLALAYKENENYNLAINILKELAEQNEDDQEVLLMLAENYLNRGYTNKANEVLERLISISPQNAKVWSCYLRLSRYRGIYISEVEIIDKALSINEDMFIDNYLILHTPLYNVLRFNYNEKVAARLIKCMYKGFLAAKHVDRNDYEAIVVATKALAGNKNHFTAVEAVLPKLERLSLIYDSQKDIVKIRSTLETLYIHDDKAVKEELKYIAFHSNHSYSDMPKDLRLELLEVKIFVLENIQEMQKSISRIKDNYPLAYSLDEQFYEMAADIKNNKKNVIALKRKLAAERKTRQHDVFFDLNRLLRGLSYDDEDDEDFFDDIYETQIPYTREEKKIGRNDPCPCGSGKKYKHCCG